MNGTDYGHIDHWYWNKPATSPTQAPQPATAPVPGTASANAYRITHYRAAGKIRGNALPRQQVIRDARRAAAGPGVPVAPPTAAASARLMKLGDFDRASQLVTGPLLASSRLVGRSRSTPQ
jgi:hypothetical protein